MIDGSIYIGEWANDMMHGKGKIVTSNEESYEGDWVCN
jgi:hypothetical protein